jgi:xanthine dehydrogenase YagS FAD-binding subunit
MGGVATRPWRAHEAEASLAGQMVSMDTFARAATIAFRDAHPYAHNAYKIPLGQQAIVRNLRDLTVQENA